MQARQQFRKSSLEILRQMILQGECKVYCEYPDDKNGNKKYVALGKDDKKLFEIQYVKKSIPVLNKQTEKWLMTIDEQSDFGEYTQEELQELITLIDKNIQERDEAEKEKINYRKESDMKKVETAEKKALEFLQQYRIQGK